MKSRANALGSPALPNQPQSELIGDMQMYSADAQTVDCRLGTKRRLRIRTHFIFVLFLFFFFFSPNTYQTHHPMTYLITYSVSRIRSTSFPGSLSNLSLCRWEEDSGCGWLFNLMLSTKSVLRRKVRTQ